MSEKTKKAEKEQIKINLSFRKDSGIMDAIRKSGKKPTEYARIALAEKLRKDGYLQP